MSILFCFSVYGQVKKQESAQLSTFQPIGGQHYYFSSTTGINQNNSFKGNSLPPEGNTGEDVIANLNKGTKETMGYSVPAVPPSDPYLAHQYILNQYNQSVNPTKDYRQQRELLDLMNEIHTEENSRCTDSNYFKSSEFITKSKSYSEALQHLKDMLSDKRKLSVADAYFEIEKAYGNSYLSKEEYDRIIEQSIDFIKNWLVQNRYNLKDNDALHLGIQKFMGDTLTITLNTPDSKTPSQKIEHLPFFYDYNDFKGEKDFRNYFSTKCLATGAGQCNSLPAVYSSLAEGLGAKSYLSFAPNHSFIKYPDDNGNIHNYEPTSNWKISDKWYEDNMFISPQAEKTGIYLDTLTRKQIVANCILDLAFGYLNKFGSAGGEYVKECVNVATQYFPKRNNIEAYFVYSSLLARQLERELNRANIKVNRLNNTSIQCLILRQKK